MYHSARTAMFMTACAGLLFFFLNIVGVPACYLLYAIGHAARRHGWGRATHSSVGVVVRLLSAGRYAAAMYCFYCRAFQTLLLRIHAVLLPSDAVLNNRCCSLCYDGESCTPACVPVCACTVHMRASHFVCSAAMDCV